MGYLAGFEEYLAENYTVSVFDEALASGGPWVLHVHGRQSIRASILGNSKWGLTLAIEGQGRQDLPKIQVKYLYPAGLSVAVEPLVKMDERVRAMALGPLFAPGKRFFVKNKSLFPLMKEKEVLLFTLLEGEVIRGIVGGFSRYDIAVNVKGGLPVTILRHAVYDLRNKKGRSYLKSFQENQRDWEKSALFVSGSDSGLHSD